MPKSHASSAGGASVRSTSQSGTTTLSSTWLDESTPLQTLSTTKPGLRHAGGADGGSRRRPSTTGAWRAITGSTAAMSTALSTSRAPVTSGIRRTALEADAQRHPARAGAEGVADVARGAHVGQRPDADVAREDRDPVDVAGVAPGGLEDRQHRQHRDERRHAADQRPGEVERRLDRARQRPQRLGAHPVGEPAHRQLEQQRDAGRDRHAEARPGRRRARRPA